MSDAAVLPKPASGLHMLNMHSRVWSRGERRAGVPSQGTNSTPTVPVPICVPYLELLLLGVDLSAAAAAQSPQHDWTTGECNVQGITIKTHVLSRVEVPYIRFTPIKNCSPTATYLQISVNIPGPA